MEPKLASIDTVLGFYMVCYQSDSVAYMVKIFKSSVRLVGKAAIAKHGKHWQACWPALSTHSVATASFTKLRDLDNLEQETLEDHVYLRQTSN